jgi:hypothetical protein
MLVLQLLFSATTILLILYCIFSILEVRNEAVVVVLSWALAIHALLFVLVLMTTCKTDTAVVRSVYMLGALLLVGNAVMETLGTKAGPMIDQHVRAAAVGVLTMGVLVLGLFRTEIYKQCVRYKGLLRTRYLAARGPNMQREAKVDVAEKVINDLSLGAGNIRRVLRMR